jgi:2-polyprenyl-3-methyl-5-hydroxy-6-metoxy-1,4-benzoquinol methylase
MMNMDTAIKEEYILKVGGAGATRLSLLNEVHGPYSQALLHKTNTSGEMKILELGCGTGHMALWMASHLVPYGKVTAVDMSVEQIRIAKRVANRHKIANVEFKSLSIYDLDQLEEQYDVIYCRYLLLHLVDPIQALQNAIKLLAPNGRMVCEEPTISTSFCYPYSEAYAKSRSLLKHLSEIKHLDFEIGMKLQKLLMNINCKILDINFIQPILKNKNERRLLDMLFDECSDLYVKLNLSTYDEIKQIKENLQQLVQDNHALLVFPRTTQIIARKAA